MSRASCSHVLRFSALAALLLIFPVFACDKNTDDTRAPSEDSVDQLTRDLLAALANNERERAQSLSNSLLAAELDERTVVQLGRTLTWLGPIQSLAHVEETPVSGGVERRYRVGFTRDELTLMVTVVGGKVEGFEFDEGQWDAASERASQVGSGSLRVAEFVFVGPDGQPVSSPPDPSDVRYSLALEGLDAQLREHHVVIVKQVFDDDGNQVFRQREDDDVRFPQAETGSDGGTITGAVQVPGPGKYELELKITDLVAGQSLVHRVVIEI